MADRDFAHVFEPGDGPWTIIALHGTGGDEHDLVPLVRELAPRANILSPRGKVLENGVSPRFFKRLAVGKLDIPDLLARTDELADFVRRQVNKHDLDPSRVAAIGLSNGANIAASLIFRHPDLLKAAALLRPMLPYEPDEMPAVAGTRVLIAAGEGDPFSSAEQTERLAQILRDGGAEVTLRVQPGAGHGLTPGDLEECRDWFAGLLQA